MRQGNKRALNGEDLFSLLKEDKSEKLVETLEKEWTREVEHCQVRGTRPRLWRTVLRIIPITDYLLLVLYRLLCSTFFVSTPVILYFFLRSLSNSSETQHKAMFLFAALLGLAAILKSLCAHHSYHIGDLWCIRIKVATVGLIYKKVFIFLITCDFKISDVRPPLPGFHTPYSKMAAKRKATGASCTKTRSQGSIWVE